MERGNGPTQIKITNRERGNGFSDAVANIND
jgi:hypothetical protein